MRLAHDSQSWLRSKFETWVKRRNPRSNVKELTQRNIFILPTKEGYLFGFLLLILLLTGINYQNSLIYLFTFVLGVLFVLSIHFCFNNMAGLSLRLVGTSDCFVGDVGGFSVVLKSEANQYHESLVFIRSGLPLQKVDVDSLSTVDVMLEREATKRGEMRLGRVMLETRFPLGLIRAWTWCDFDDPVLVYPKPVKGNKILNGHSEGEPERVGMAVSGHEELAGLRDYSLGDSMNRIAWKHYASKGELYVKALEENVSSSCWLRYDDYPFDGKEQRLSHLCYDVMDATEKGLNYGLVLPKSTIELGQGESHRLACLRALAIA